MASTSFHGPSPATPNNSANAITVDQKSFDKIYTPLTTVGVDEKTTGSGTTATILNQIKLKFAEVAELLKQSFVEQDSTGNLVFNPSKLHEIEQALNAAKELCISLADPILLSNCLTRLNNVGKLIRSESLADLNRSAVIAEHSTYIFYAADELVDEGKILAFKRRHSIFIEHNCDNRFEIWDKHFISYLKERIERAEQSLTAIAASSSSLSAEEKESQAKEERLSVGKTAYTIARTCEALYQVETDPNIQAKFLAIMFKFHGLYLEVMAAIDYPLKWIEPINIEQAKNYGVDVNSEMIGFCRKVISYFETTSDHMPLFTNSHCVEALIERFHGCIAYLDTDNKLGTQDAKGDLSSNKLKHALSSAYSQQRALYLKQHQLFSGSGSQIKLSSFQPEHRLVYSMLRARSAQFLEQSGGTSAPTLRTQATLGFITEPALTLEVLRKAHQVLAEDFKYSEEKIDLFFRKHFIDFLSEGINKEQDPQAKVLAQSALARYYEVLAEDKTTGSLRSRTAKDVIQAISINNSLNIRLSQLETASQHRLFLVPLSQLNLDPNQGLSSEIEAKMMRLLESGSRYLTRTEIWDPSSNKDIQNHPLRYEMVISRCVEILRYFWHRANSSDGLTATQLQTINKARLDLLNFGIRYQLSALVEDATETETEEQRRAKSVLHLSLKARALAMYTQAHRDRIGNFSVEIQKLRAEVKNEDQGFANQEHAAASIAGPAIALGARAILFHNLLDQEFSWASVSPFPDKGKTGLSKPGEDGFAFRENPASAAWYGTRLQRYIEESPRLASVLRLLRIA